MLRARFTCLKHIALALCAVVLMLGIVETGLRVRHSYQTQVAAMDDSNAGLSLPSWNCHHQLKPLKATTRANSDSKLPIAIRTNSFGLRGDLIRVPKSEGVFRIVFLGDDTVFAAEILEQETFCQLIEKQLTRSTGRTCEVINAGVPSYCPLLSYLHFKHELMSLNPDLVVLNFDMSDVADDYRYRRHARMGPDQAPLLCTHPSLQSPAPGSPNATGTKFLLVQSLKQQLGLLPADDDGKQGQPPISTVEGYYAWTREQRTDWATYIDQALRPIGHIRDLANQLSCPLVVTIVPAPWQVSPSAMPNPESRRKWGIAPAKMYDARLATDRIHDYLRLAAIPCCDVTDRFQSDPKVDALFLQTTPSLSRQGHQLVAELVADFLKHKVSASDSYHPILSRSPATKSMSE